MPEYLASKLASIQSFTRFARGRGMPGGPLEIFLETSNVCDLRCVMCTEFSALNPHRLQFLRLQQRGFLDADAVTGSLERVLAGALLVHCSGYGEPTLHPNFKEFISFVSQYETLISFITNGMHIDEAMADFLVEHNVYRLMISFSGTTKEEYENIYVGGSFERVLGGIRAIAAAKRRHNKQYPIIVVNSLGFKHQVEHFDEFVDMMIEAGANNIQLKKLQPYAHIPELFEHVSVMRPWAEGDTIERAKEAGRRSGVEVSAAEYEAAGVASESEYAGRMDELRAAAEQQGATYGDASIDKLPHIKKPQSREPMTVDASVIDLQASEADALQQLQVAEIEGLEPDSFFCMEPFKTFYVRRDSSVKPCCFSNTPPYLGALNENDGIDVWKGAGFSAFRDGIIAGQYPKPFCERCVKDRIGPTDHYVHDLVDNFVRWYSATHGSEFERRLEQEDPEVYLTLTRQNSHAIVNAFRATANGHPPPSAGSAAPPSLHQLIAARMEGNFEFVTDNRAIGWVWLPDYPSYRPPITVWAGSTPVATGVACRSREDVAADGRGDGFFGFFIPLPARTPDWTRAELSVTVGHPAAGRRL